MSRLLGIGAGLVAVLLLAWSPVAAAGSLVWIELQGPVAHLPTPRPDYTLEVGGQAWTIDHTMVGASLALQVGGPVVVRLRALPACQPVVMFVAQPGSSHIIRLLGQGAFRVEDWSKNGLDLMNGLPAGGTPACPALPDTSTVPADPAPGGEGGAPWVLLACGAGAVLATARRTRPNPNRCGSPSS